MLVVVGTNLGSKVSWVGYCPPPSTASSGGGGFRVHIPHCRDSQLVAPIDSLRPPPILAISSRVHLSTTTTHTVDLPSLSLTLHTPELPTPVPILSPDQFPQFIGLLSFFCFSSRERFNHPSLGPPCYLGSLGLLVTTWLSYTLLLAYTYL